MKLNTVFQLGGIAAIAGSVLLVIGWVSATAFGDSNSVGVRWIGLFAFIFIQLGLVAIYAYQAEETGITGLIGFILALAATSIFIGFTIGSEHTTVPEPVLGPPAGISFAIGFIILGISTWQAGKIPVFSAALWIVGVIVYTGGVASLYNPVVILGAVIFGAGFSWAGLQLIRHV